MDHDPDATSLDTTTLDPDALAIRAERCDGLECPTCDAPTMGYWVTPAERDPRCRCDTCGALVTLYDYLLAQGLSDREVVGFALAAMTGASPATA